MQIRCEIWATSTCLTMIDYHRSFRTAVDLGAGRTAKSVSAGYWHSCALLDDNIMKCWGYNDSGELGLDDASRRQSPATADFSAAIGTYAGAPPGPAGPPDPAGPPGPAAPTGPTVYQSQYAGVRKETSAAASFGKLFSHCCHLIG